MFGSLFQYNVVKGGMAQGSAGSSKELGWLQSAISSAATKWSLSLHHYNRTQVYLIQGCLSRVHPASSKGLRVPAGSALHPMHVRLLMTVQLGFGQCQAKLLTRISFLERTSGPIRTSPIRTARTLRTACPSPTMAAELLVSQHQCCLP